MIVTTLQLDYLRAKEVERANRESERLRGRDQELTRQDIAVKQQDADTRAAQQLFNEQNEMLKTLVTAGDKLDLNLATDEVIERIYQMAGSDTAKLLYGTDKATNVLDASADMVDRTASTANSVKNLVVP